MATKLTDISCYFSERYYELCGSNATLVLAHFATELVCFCYTRLSDMRRQFKVSFYIRSNYENKEEKFPIMLRIFLNREMANLVTTKLFVKKSMWNNSTSRMKGRTAEALSLNASLDSLPPSLYEMFWKMKGDEDLTVERLKQVYLGRDKEFTTLLPVLNRYLDHIAQQVGKSLSKDSLRPLQKH